MKFTLSVMGAALLMGAGLGAPASAAAADTLQTAIPIKGGQRISTESIESAEDVDWFKFTISSRQDATFSVNGLPDSAMVELYDTARDARDGDWLDYNSESGGAATVGHVLEPGTHYVSVEAGWRGDISGRDGAPRRYSAQLTLDPRLPDRGADTPDRALQIASGVPVRETLDEDEDYDWFKFVIPGPAPQRVNLSLADAPDASFVSWFASLSDAVDGEEIDYASGPTAALGQVVGAGTYYVCVETGYRGGDFDKPYTLRLTLSSVPINVVAKPVNRRRVLAIDVAPNMGDANYHLIVQKRTSSSWRTARRVTSQGAADRVRVNVPRGVYRVLAPAQLGMNAGMSRSVSIRR